MPPISIKNINKIGEKVRIKTLSAHVKNIHTLTCFFKKINPVKGQSVLAVSKIKNIKFYSS